LACSTGYRTVEMKMGVGASHERRHSELPSALPGWASIVFQQHRLGSGFVGIEAAVVCSLEQKIFMCVPNNAYMPLAWIQERLETVYKRDERYSDKAQSLFSLDLGAPEVCRRRSVGS
jgi:dTDP-4-dehydrorhamnose 3,5-epimerase-like enzyme